MTAGIIVILHDRTQQHYAAELAAALSPAPALPLRLAEDGEGRAQIGAGALAVVICGRHTDGAAVLRAVAYAPAHLLVCCFDDARAPSVDSSGQIVRLKGQAAIDAAILQPAIADLQRSLAAHASGERLGRRDAAMAAVGERGAELDSLRKQNLAVRSAFGLAVAMAVVGVVAPAISARAVAPSGTENQADTAATAAQTRAAATSAAAPSEAVEASAPAGAASAAPALISATEAQPLDDRAAAISLVDIAAAEPAVVAAPEDLVETAAITGPATAESDKAAADAVLGDKPPAVDVSAAQAEGADKRYSAVRPVK